MTDHYDVALPPGDTLTVSGPARVEVSFAEGEPIKAEVTELQTFGPYALIARVDVWSESTTPED